MGTKKDTLEDLAKLFGMFDARRIMAQIQKRENRGKK